MACYADRFNKKRRVCVKGENIYVTILAVKIKHSAIPRWRHSRQAKTV